MSKKPTEEEIIAIGDQLKQALVRGFRAGKANEPMLHNPYNPYRSMSPSTLAHIQWAIWRAGYMLGCPYV